ncbi:hypothetical protein [Flavobacterium daemonense]|uniref:hypothetical protein n=1 Tax=Flavobacterium daemonense TaxID=1393049 RepID=UPI00118496C6|nr:hypothetical protein [Flavobacterium daemonense]KAF2327270.1 hypothetical protein FND99_18905 [Flavobacterium daemonense]
MKHLNLFVVLTFCFLVFNSCSSDEEKPKQNNSFSLVGDWYNYKQSKLRVDAGVPAVITTCGTAGSGFDCNLALTYYSDGTGKIQPQGYNFTYSYIDGIYKANGTIFKLSVINKDEFSTSSRVTQQGVLYENTLFYKRK